MNNERLFNINGITIQELIVYLQEQCLDRDGKVQVAIDSSAGITAEQVMLFDNGNVLLLAKTDNPCIDIYYQDKSVHGAQRYLNAEVIGVIEAMQRKHKGE